MLEPTTNTKCKPGRSQWVLFKLESCCDVMKRLFSTAIKAGQHNVPAQEVLLEENVCNAQLQPRGAPPPLKKFCPPTKNWLL